MASGCSPMCLGKVFCTTKWPNGWESLRASSGRRLFRLCKDSGGGTAGFVSGELVDTRGWPLQGQAGHSAGGLICHLVVLESLDQIVQLQCELGQVRACFRSFLCSHRGVLG